MKVRRTSHRIHAESHELDAVDAFLVLEVWGTVSIDALIARAPCSAQQVLRRVRRLVSLGVLELVGAREEPALAVEPHGDEAVTTRPVALEAASSPSNRPTGRPAHAQTRNATFDEETRPIMTALSDTQ